MAMTAPKTDQELDTHLEENQIEAQKYLVGTVAPDGSVSHSIAIPGEEGGNGAVQGLDICRHIEGDPQLTLYAKRTGWTLLEKRCKDEGCPERYANWLAVMRAGMPPNAEEVEMPKKKDGTPDMSMVYPPSVLAMRDKGGVKQIRRRLVPGKGLVEVREDGKDGEVLASPDRIRALAGVMLEVSDG